METYPSAQSLLQKLNFGSSSQITRKSRYQTFLALSSFTGFLYPVPNILPRIVDIYLFGPFLTLPYNLSLSALESQFLNSREHLTSCKHLSSVHLKGPCEVAIFIFMKINKEFSRAFYEIFIPGWKNVDYMENLKFSFPVEISSRVS